MTVQELFSKHRIRYWEAGDHENVRQGWIGVDCPWCGATGKAYLGINLAGTYAVCWQCGSHSIWDVLSRLIKTPLDRDVCSWIKGLRRGLTPPSSPDRSQGRYMSPVGLHPLTASYMEYLRRRGLNAPETRDRWGLKATGPAGRLSWRLWAPILLNGEAVSWTTRSIGDRQPRYISAGPEEESVPHKRLLYGMDFVGHSVVIVEGPVDAWAIGPGAVATMGISVTSEQFNTISQMPVRVICFDSEPQAQRRANKLADRLMVLPGETHVVELESGADPAEADHQEVELLRKRFLK